MWRQNGHEVSILLSHASSSHSLLSLARKGQRATDPRSRSFPLQVQGPDAVSSWPPACFGDGPGFVTQVFKQVLHRLGWPDGQLWDKEDFQVV